MSAAAKANVSKPERIRAWLKDNPDGGRASEIAGALKISTTEACTALHDMHASGELVRCKVETPGGRSEYHYRFSATAGSPRAGQQWRTMTVTGGPKPPRPEATTRPRGEAPTPGKPTSLPATVLPVVQAVAAVVQAPVADIQDSVPAPAAVEQDALEASSSAGEAASGAPFPAAAVRGDTTAHYPEEWGPSDARQLSCVCGDPDPTHADASAGSFTATSLVEALIELERTVDPDAPPARPLEEAIAQAAAEVSRDWEPEPAPVPPPAMTPRFGLFSDGTLILEGLPNLPPIIAIRREHTRALVKYLLAVNE